MRVTLKSHGGIYDTIKHILRDGILDYKLMFCMEGITISGIGHKYWDVVGYWSSLVSRFPNAKIALNLKASYSLDLVDWCPIEDVEIENLKDFTNRSAIYVEGY